MTFSVLVALPLPCHGMIEGERTIILENLSDIAVQKHSEHNAWYNQWGWKQRGANHIARWLCAAYDTFRFSIAQRSYSIGSH